jgi:radical SAM superfamily enzyme YgiQ (UPF0313 family)
MSCPRVMLLSTDDHTLGIQTTGSIVLEETGIDPTLAYLPSHLPRYPASIEHRIVEAIANEIEQDASRPTIIGFSLKELSLSRSTQLASSLKERFRDRVTIVAGGAYASLAAEAVINAFDHVVVGSGIGILPIINSIAHSDRADRVISRPPQAFHYPLFKEALVLDVNGRIKHSLTRPLAHAQYKQAPAIEVVAGSGCSYACTFCEVSALKEMFGKQYKIAISSPQSIIELIANSVSAGGAKYVYFFDEDFLLKSQSWIDEFAALYAARVGLPFFIFATPASVARSPRKLLALAAVGLDTVNMGVQSGSGRISIDLFGRYKDAGAVREAVHFLVELYQAGKITSPPMLDVIALNPYEGAPDVAQTLELLLALPTPFETAVHCMSLFEGTPLKSKAVREGRIPNTYRFQYDLHDFESRLWSNELKLDYTDIRSLQWLHLNVLLYSLNGVHTKREDERWAGALTEEKLRQEWARNGNIALSHILGLIHRIPNPMENNWYAWERSLANISSVKEGWEQHASAAAA